MGEMQSNLPAECDSRVECRWARWWQSEPRHSSRTKWMRSPCICSKCPEQSESEKNAWLLRFNCPAELPLSKWQIRKERIVARAECRRPRGPGWRPSPWSPAHLERLSSRWASCRRLSERWAPERNPLNSHLEEVGVSCTIKGSERGGNKMGMIWKRPNYTDCSIGVLKSTWEGAQLGHEQSVGSEVVGCGRLWRDGCCGHSRHCRYACQRWISAIEHVLQKAKEGLMNTDIWQWVERDGSDR